MIGWIGQLLAKYMWINYKPDELLNYWVIGLSQKGP